MKTALLISVAICLAVVVRVNNGQVKFNGISIKPGTGTLHVRPAGVVIRPQ